MTDTPDLDRAIRAYNKAYDVPDDWPIRDVDREAFRAGIAELLRGMDLKEEMNGIDVRIGFYTALAEIRRRAGLEGEG